MTISISVKGIPSAQAFLLFKNKETKKLANEAIIKAGFFVQEKVQNSIAHGDNAKIAFDTGTFMRSVKAEQKKPLTATISSNVSYAKHLEYGTSRMPARPHFRNTAKKNENRVRDFIDAEIKKL